MARAKNSKSQEFDTLVVGAGLSGLIMAHQLESTGRKVVLVEALDATGGNCRPYKSPAGVIDHGLKLLPNVEGSKEIIAWLETILQKSLGAKLIEAPPLNYDSGRFQPFVGFGDYSPEAHDEISYFATTEYWSFELTPKDWVTILGSSFTGDLWLQSHITKFQVEDHFITEAIVNGSKRVSAREVVTCVPPPVLGTLLPEEVPARTRQKLIKGEYFTSVHLDMIHPGAVTDSRAVHILKGANEEPLVGMFHPSQEAETGHQYQLSQWLTFIPFDLTNDNETIANALKKIKRQVKRAYENATDHLIHERILVVPSSHGQTDLELTAHRTLGKIENLWPVSNFFAPERNLLGALTQAKLTLEKMGDFTAYPDVEDEAPKAANHEGSSATH